MTSAKQFCSVVLLREIMESGCVSDYEQIANGYIFDRVFIPIRYLQDFAKVLELVNRAEDAENG